MNKKLFIISIFIVCNAFGQLCPDSIPLNTFSNSNPAINDLGQATLHDGTLSTMYLADNRLVLETIPGQSGYWVSDIDSAGCRDLSHIKYVELVWTASASVSVDVSFLTALNAAQCSKRTWLTSNNRGSLHPGPLQKSRFLVPKSMDLAHAIVIGIPRVEGGIEIIIDSIVFVPECATESEGDDGRNKVWETESTAIADPDGTILSNVNEVHSQDSSCWRPSIIHAMIAVIAILVISL